MTDLTLDQVLDALEPRAAQSFAKALATLAQYEADPVILKSELAELRSYGLNRSFEDAWKVFIKQPFFWDGGYQSLSETDKKLEDVLGLYPEVHTVAGYLKKVSAFKGESKMRDTMLDILHVLAPIGERANALKDKVGKRAPKVTKTSMEMAEREAKAMTCAICGRGILAETGKIAHHGYTRPGDGYQTSSCAGAKELPFEVTRDFLATYIGWQKDRLAGLRLHLENVEAEKVSLTWSYTDKTGCTRMWEQGIDRQVSVTRETYAEKAAIVLAARFKVPGREPSVPSFDQIKDHAVAEIQREIAGAVRYIEFQEARYAGWKGQTHRWEGDAWIALEAA